MKASKIVDAIKALQASQDFIMNMPFCADANECENRSNLCTKLIKARVPLEFEMDSIEVEIEKDAA